MADFRKWFLAFAVVAFVFSMSTPASAQVGTPALQCTANAGVPPIVRAEGLAELVGDVTLNCNGGKPTPAGAVVPSANIQIFLNTNITSRLLANPLSEALLLVDEPHSAANPATPLTPCVTAGSGVCPITSDGLPADTYNGTAGHYNVFQGQQQGANSIAWLGFPIDPPGTAFTRVFRITNIRANANQLGVSSTLVPTQIVEYISVTGSTALSINNPQQTVGFIQPGLVTSIQKITTQTFLQCNSANNNIAGTNTKALQTGGQNFQQFSVRFDEGFATAFKEANVAESSGFVGGTTGFNGFTITVPTAQNQNVPGAIYSDSETGFYNGGLDPTPVNPPGTTLSIPATPVFPATNNLSLAGLASQGTRLMVQFANVPTGTQLFVPTAINLVNASTHTGATGVVVLTSTDANGAGGFSAVSATDTTEGIAPVSIVNGSGAAVYEVLFSNPSVAEELNVPVAVAFISNPGTNLPAPGMQATAAANFAPQSTVTTADASAPIPRFAPAQPARNAFIVTSCSCNILLPFVTNQAGFDTGVALANTSQDPFGTTPQQGTVKLNYYGGTTGGGAAPAAQTTNAVLPAGQELIFTLSNGGNLGIAATPGFQGYIIAASKFQYCHAFAFISDLGAQRVAEGYLGLVLDSGGINRTGQIGEVAAH
ncbi:MAG: hypothetical protein ABI165_07150 [Bryobacteraceae bacterium]